MDHGEPLQPSYNAATSSSQSYHHLTQHNHHHSDYTSSDGDCEFDEDRRRRQSGSAQKANKSKRRNLSRSNRGDDNRMRQQSEQPRYNRGDDYGDEYDGLCYDEQVYDEDHWDMESSPQYEKGYDQKQQKSKEKSNSSHRYNQQNYNDYDYDDDDGLVVADQPVRVHFQSNLQSSSRSVAREKYCIPPAPSPLNGPYLNGKLRPEYRHMSGPPYPPLHLLTPQVAHPADDRYDYSCQEKPSTSADRGARHDNAMQVEQFGRVTRVTYHPDQAPVTYIDNPDGKYGNDYMYLSVFTLCCCNLIGGMIGLMLSYVTRHLVQSGDARRSRILGRVTLGWNIISMITGIIIAIVLFTSYREEIGLSSF